MIKKAGILKSTESLVLIIIWVAIISVPVFLFQSENVIIWDMVIKSWLGLFPFFILFVVNHFILVPFLLFRNKKTYYFVSVFLFVFIFSTSVFYLEKTRLNNHPREPDNVQFLPNQKPDRTGPRQGVPPLPQHDRNPFSFPPIINTVIISFLIIGFDTGLRMMVRWSSLEQEKTLLEKENVQNQLAFLRNQVSPHFFMNTLNNIHALIDVDAEEAKESIIKLSKLMRHLLYESQAELVPLSKELEFIQSYINLMKLRFSDKVKINLSFPDHLPDKLIPPLLFTSFVENAFKHGISYQNLSYIDISFFYNPEILTFEIKNSNPRQVLENADSGIGIQNSRKRLDILYGENYTLKINDDKHEFNLILKIPV